MESLLNRYRNITVLLLVLFGQLLLLAVQVKNDRDVRMIRIWTVMAVTPVARVAESLRGGTIGVVRNYILLRDTNQENRRLKAEVDRLKLENIFLKNDLNTADRAKALQMFQTRIPSRAVAASVIGATAGANSKVLFVDRGSASGIQRGMAVVTPEGIVGKVIASYPTASQVMLVTDPDFAAGVVSQKTLTRGTLKGQGTPMCRVDYITLEDKIQPGEMLFTSGDDRVFPRGFPVGLVKVVRNGQPPFKEIYVEPSGVQHGVEDVLILIEGVHQAIPEAAVPSQSVYIAPPPPAPAGDAAAAPAGGGYGGVASSSGTEADKLRTQYKALGDAQGHKFGEGLPGSKPPNFNMPLPAPGTQPPASGGGRGQAAGATQQPSGTPGAIAPGTQPPAGAAPNRPAAPAAQRPVATPGAQPPAATAGQPAQRPVVTPGTQPPAATAPNRPTAPASQPAQPPAGTPGKLPPSGATPNRPATPAGQPAQRPGVTPGKQPRAATVPNRPTTPAGQSAQRPGVTPGTQPPAANTPNRPTTPTERPEGAPKTQSPPSGAGGPSAPRGTPSQSATGSRTTAGTAERRPLSQTGPER